MQSRGDWANPLLLRTLRRYSGMTLKQTGARVGRMDYTAIAMAIKRFEQKAGETHELSRLIGKVKAKCEMRRRDPNGTTVIFVASVVEADAEQGFEIDKARDKARDKGWKNGLS